MRGLIEKRMPFTLLSEIATDHWGDVLLGSFNVLFCRNRISLISKRL
jgi:hypothetical protein